MPEQPGTTYQYRIMYDLGDGQAVQHVFGPGSERSTRAEAAQYAGQMLDHCLRDPAGRRTPGGRYFVEFQEVTRSPWVEDPAIRPIPLETVDDPGQEPTP